MKEVVIAGAARTPVGSFQGSLTGVKVTRLGSIVIAEALKRAGVKPDQVEEVIMGCVLPAGLGQAPARQAAIGADIPVTIGATTINKVCGSGLKSVMLADAMIKAGDADIIVAGGMESMTNSPYLLPEGRQGFRMGPKTAVDSMVFDGLWNIYTDEHMGSCADMNGISLGRIRMPLH
jgi:acetyl-CoA C-acetyltransferase